MLPVAVRLHHLRRFVSHQIQQEDTEMESKRLCKAERSSSDIISKLPEAILETILCLLPTTKEVARTSILSREWRYKWTKISKLKFYTSEVCKKTKEEKNVQGTNMDTRCKPFYNLHQILLLRQGQIHDFTLHIDIIYIDEYYFGLDQMLLYLSKNHAVKKLTLTGTDYWDKLPISIFSLHHLTDLHLTCFDLDYQPIFNGFRSLRSLYLRNLGISADALLHLLSSCPSLKILSLLICRTYRNGESTIIELFKCLPGIEHLTTFGLIFQWLVLVPIPRELPALLFNLKYFCMEKNCFLHGQALGFLLMLIKCSPNLEKVKLQISDCDKCVRQYSVVWEEYSDVWLEHLVELEIKGFNNFKPEMKFVKFILARSPKLKKVSIECLLSMKKSLKMLQVLLQALHTSSNLCLTIASKDFRSVNFLKN